MGPHDEQRETWESGYGGSDAEARVSGGHIRGPLMSASRRRRWDDCRNGSLAECRDAGRACQQECCLSGTRRPSPVSWASRCAVWAPVRTAVRGCRARRSGNRRRARERCKERAQPQTQPPEIESRRDVLSSPPPVRRLQADPPGNLALGISAVHGRRSQTRGLNPLHKAIDHALFAGFVEGNVELVAVHGHHFSVAEFLMKYALADCEQ